MVKNYPRSDSSLLTCFYTFAAMGKMHRAYLLLGGNLGDRLALQNQAVERLIASVGALVVRSSVYESEPWGFDNAPAFLNQVAVFETLLQPMELLRAIQQIELDLGRVRHTDGKYHSRCIDIDILFYDDAVLNADELEVPHPRLHLRQFTMLPMQEVEHDFCHPIIKQTMDELLANCPDQSSVNKLVDAV